MLRLQSTAVEPGRPHWTPAIRKRFLDETAGQSARAVAVVTLLTSVLLLAWAPGDFECFPEHAVRFTWYRVAAVVAAVAFAVWAIKAKRAWVKLLAMCLWFVPWAMQSAAMIPRTPDDLLSHTFVIVIAQLGSLGIMLWSWQWCLAMCLVMVGICEVALLRVTEAGYDTFAAHGYLLTGMAFATLFTAVKYQGAREQFEQRLRLEDGKERSEGLLNRVTDLRAERLTWLENLAGFLRQELKNSLSPSGSG